MTTLYDMLITLSEGEFSQAQLGSFNNGEYESEIDPKQYSQVIGYLNAGLKTLYSQFWLASGEVTIRQSEDIYLYKLDAKHALTNVDPGAVDPPAPYIEDSVDNPFLDNVLMIEEIWDADGCPLLLNDRTGAVTLTTPNYRSIRVPAPQNDFLMKVGFRATHPIIQYTPGMDPRDVEVEIPHQLYEALCYFIASKHFTTLNVDGGQNASDYHNKYLAQIDMVLQAGLYIQPQGNIGRFEARGWI